MKKQMVLAALFAAVAVFADEAAKPDGVPEAGGKPAAQVSDEVAARRRLLRGGGILFRKGEGGSIRFLDMRAERKPSLVPEAEHICRFTASWTDVAEMAPAKGVGGYLAAREALRTNEEVRIAIAVVEEGADSPALLVCPEDRLAVINVDQLRVDLPADKSDAYAIRLKKELWRAVAFAADGFDIDYPCVLKAVASPADIDAIEMEMFCPPVSGKVKRYAKKLGVAPLRMYPYSVAVREGWAPAPTNDAQRAVWDFVKTQMATNAPAAPAK